MSTAAGREAEARAADFLRQRGWKISSQNWRNRFCEIDLVAQKDGRIHFVEVKYRRSPGSGSATDYITRDKGRRLIKAAAVYMAEENLETDYQIDVLSIDGDPPRVEYLPNALEGPLL